MKITIRKIIKRGVQYWEADCMAKDFRRRYLAPKELLSKREYSKLSESDLIIKLTKWASRKADEDRLAIPEQRLVDPSVATMKDLLNYYLEYARSSVKQSTLETYQRRYEKHLLPNFGTMLARDFDDTQLFNFEKSLEKKGISKSVQSNYSKSVLAVMKFCKKHKIIKAVPESTLKADPKEDRIDQKHFLNTEQQELILTAAKQLSPIHYSAVISGLDLGLRMGEICGLKWSDIDTTKKRATIRHNIVILKNEIKCESPKGKKIKPVAISDRFIESLAVLERTSEFCYGGINPHKYRWMWREIVDLAHKINSNIGIKAFWNRTHVLRHTCGTNIADAINDPLAVQQQLRHAQLATSMVYIHADKLKDVDKILDKLSKKD